MPATRPASIPGSAGPPVDDGLFGPNSVTWRAMASPATAIGATTAVLVQMLNPRVMRMIAQRSSFFRDPARRAQLTGEYTLTITYGDTAQAERAGETLRGIHHHLRATDPETGAEYGVDEPDLLLWVHNSLTWSLLRAYRRFGPRLSPVDESRFVAEQRTAARLVGIDPPEQAAGSTAELDAYIEGIRPRMAYVIETRLMRQAIVPDRLLASGAALLRTAMAHAAVDLLTDEMRDLYGFRWTPLHRWAVDLAATRLIAAAAAKMPYAATLAAARAQLEAHAFGQRPRTLAPAAH
jgi:uncharacterized protein (DUF2236 family)